MSTCVGARNMQNVHDGVNEKVYVKQEHESLSEQCDDMSDYLSDGSHHWSSLSECSSGYEEADSDINDYYEIADRNKPGNSSSQVAKVTDNVDVATCSKTKPTHFPKISVAESVEPEISIKLERFDGGNEFPDKNSSHSLPIETVNDNVDVTCKKRSINFPKPSISDCDLQNVSIKLELYDDIHKISSQTRQLKYSIPFVNLERCDHMLTVIPGQTFYGTSNVGACNVRNSFPSEMRSRRPAKLLHSQDFFVDGRDKFWYEFATTKVLKKRKSEQGNSKTTTNETKCKEKNNVKSQVQDHKTKSKHNVSRSRVKNKKKAMKDNVKKRSTNIPPTNIDPNYKYMDSMCSLNSIFCIERKCSHIFGLTGQTLPSGKSPHSVIEDRQPIHKNNRRKSPHSVIDNPVPVSMTYLKDGTWTVEPVDLINGPDNTHYGTLDVQTPNEISVTYKVKREVADPDTDIDLTEEDLANEQRKLMDIQLTNAHLSVASTSQDSNRRTPAQFHKEERFTLSDGNSSAPYRDKDGFNHIEDETVIVSDDGSDVDIESDFTLSRFMTDREIINHDHSYPLDSSMFVLNSSMGLQNGTVNKVASKGSEQTDAPKRKPAILQKSQKPVTSNKNLEVDLTYMNVKEVNTAMHLHALDDIRNKHHVKLERERRKSLREDFSTLRDKFPDIRYFDRTPKITIVYRAIEEILKLEKDELILINQKQCLEFYQKRLLSRLRLLQLHLD